MSATISSNAVYPAPPPTSNDLPRSQRMRLLKSSRKLEAMLGATPMVLEVDIGTSFLDFNPSSNDSTTASRPPITPRTRARRRRGQVFEGTSNSPSSCSESSDDEKTLFDDTASESSYVFIPSTTPRAAYQPQNIPSAVDFTAKKHGGAVGNRKRSKSEAVSKPKSNKANTLPQTHVLDLPLAARGASTANNKTKTKGGKSLQPLAQPILFRLRSVPVQPSASPARSVASVATTASASSTRSHTKSTSVSTVNSNDELRSPLSPVFNTRMSTLIPEEREAREREMRVKKMAKVTRTLGENVPPELLFGTGQNERKESSLPSLPARKSIRKHRPRSLSVPMALPPAAPSVVVDNGVDVDADVSSEDDTTPKANTTPTIPTVVESKAPLPTVTVTSTTPTTPTFYQHHAKSHSHSALPISSSPYRSHSRPTQGYYSAHPIATTIAYRSTRNGDSVAKPAFSGLIGAHQGASASASTLGHYPLHRAASMSNSSLSAYPARGAASLDIHRTPAFHEQAHLIRAKSPADFVWGRKAKNGGAAGDLEDWGKRKERGWSGEWNVKDMGDVKKKLRELKGR